MNRRKFLHHAGWISAGSCVLPGLLNSCKTSDWENEGKYQGEVIILGAGISGLYAGEMLIKQGVRVKILEASSNWGGRLRSLPMATDIIKSAERKTIQGEFSVLSDLLKNFNVSLQPNNGSELYYFNGLLNADYNAIQNTFFADMLSAVSSLDGYDGADITAQTYFDTLELSPNIEAVYNVLTGQVYGTSADHISTLGISRQKQLWSSGPSNFKVKTEDVAQSIKSAAQSSLDVVEYNTTVNSIDYSGNSIQLSDTNGGVYSCDRLLITVPLHVLQRNEITFNPPLGNARETAISRIGIDTSYCALFKLQQPVWPPGTKRIIGSDIAQSFEVTDDGWVYAEVSGLQAETISSIFGDPLTIIQNQFNELYPGILELITEGALQFWEGNRSYDLVGTGNSRETLAQPVGSKLFFAGEATHTGGHHGTLHGAMESALRAVIEIMDTDK